MPMVVPRFSSNQLGYWYGKYQRRATQASRPFFVAKKQKERRPKNESPVLN